MRALILIFPLFLLGCDSVQDRRQVVARAYADILRYRDAEQKTDTAVVRLGIDSILSAHDLTHDSYLQEFRSLADDPTELRPFFELVQERLANTSGIPADPTSE